MSKMKAHGDGDGDWADAILPHVYNAAVNPWFRCWPHCGY